MPKIDLTATFKLKTTYILLRKQDTKLDLFKYRTALAYIQ